MKLTILRAVLLGVAAASLALVGCRGCERRAPGAVLELAAPGARAVGVIDDLGAAAGGLDAFVKRATAGSPDAITRLRAVVGQQLGFDPFVEAEYQKAGIDGRGGAMVFTEGSFDHPLLALPVSDEKVFDKWLTAFVERVDGANDVRTQTREGRSYKTAGRPFGNEFSPALHWALVDGYALLARPDAIEPLVAALARLATPKETRPTLASDPVWKDLATKVERGPLTLYARALEPAAGAPPASAGVLTRVRADAAGLSLESFVGLPIEGLADALGKLAPLALAGRVEGDAVAVLLTGAARPEGLTTLERQPLIKENLARALEPLTREVGLDVRNEVLPLFSGSATAAVHLIDLAGLPQALAQRRSLNALLDFVHVSITADVKDRAALLALLSRSEEALRKRGVKLRRRVVKVEGKEAVLFEPDREPAPLGWGVIGDVYVYGAGVGRLERAMAHVVTPKPTSLAPKLAGTVAEGLAKTPGATVVLVRGETLAAEAAKVISGGAGRGLPLGALLGSAVELVRKLGDVALAVTPEPSGLRLVVRQRLQ